MGRDAVLGVFLVLGLALLLSGIILGIELFVKYVKLVGIEKAFTEHTFRRIQANKKQKQKTDLYWRN